MDKLLNKLIIEQARTNKILSELLINQILDNDKYKNNKRLESYGFKGNSQTDEEGIILEIFNRIGIKNKNFIEFGCGGQELENNTLFLVKSGWKGLWMDLDPKRVLFLRNIFNKPFKSGRLKIEAENITSKNINNIFKKHNFTGEVDVLSIDVDSNDYWIWKSLDTNILNPRLVILEYNAKYKPPMEWIRKNGPEKFNKTDWMGASLQSLTNLSNKKGYKLVGCGIGGANAYFVREDLVKDKFEEPFTAENHFQKARYYLCKERGSNNVIYSGMKHGYGNFHGENEVVYD